MTDQPTVPTAGDFAGPGITSNEFIRYLTTNHKGPCPSCLKRRWAVNSLGENLSFAAPIYTTSGEEGKAFEMTGSFPIGYTPMLSLVCQECGHIQFFSSKFVSDWLQKNK